MRQRKRHNQGGMALVLTLMAVSFLVAITVQLTTSVNWQMQGAGNLRDSVQLDALNRSGLSLVRAALQADFKDAKFNSDSAHDSWHTLDSEKMSSLFGAGKLQVEVTDLSGLLQVNALAPPDGKKDPKKFKKQQDMQISLWKRLLTSDKFAVDPAEADKIIDAIIDWIDENDDDQPNGAESGQYLSLSPPYAARNAPVTYLEELLLIRGMTKELFYGIDHPLALKDFLTVAGSDGTININSAPRELLMVLEHNGNMSETTANELIEYRDEEVNRPFLGNPQWYKNVNSSMQLEDIAIVQSQYFKVTVTATQKSMTRTGTGILQRDKAKDGEQTLKYWEVR